MRIADDLRIRIESGELQPGEKLPGLPSLAKSYGTSLVTVRLAIGILRQQGLVTSIQGKGVFVREALPIRRYGIQRYSRSVWGGAAPKALLDAEGARQGASVEQQTETEQTTAPAFVVERLPDVHEGDTVHVRRRVTKLDGIINQSVDSYFSLATGAQSPALIAGEGAGGHIARINAVSPVLDVEEDIATRMPTSPEAVRLEIPDGTPVFEVLRTYHCESGPLDVTRFVIRGDMARFNYRFAVPD
jgi:GntR family transcriptional regulator